MEVGPGNSEPKIFIPLEDDRNRKGFENRNIRDYRTTPASTSRRDSDDSHTEISLGLLGGFGARNSSI
jgi:hypothetical protein